MKVKYQRWLTVYKTQITLTSKHSIIAGKETLVNCIVVIPTIGRRFPSTYGEIRQLAMAE